MQIVVPELIVVQHEQPLNYDLKVESLFLTLSKTVIIRWWYRVRAWILLFASMPIRDMCSGKE